MGFAELNCIPQKHPCLPAADAGFACDPELLELLRCSGIALAEKELPRGWGLNVSVPEVGLHYLG